MKKFIYSVLTLLITNTFVSFSTVSASANAGDMMRYYNKNKGTYLFTVNAAEIEKVKSFSYLEPQGAVFTTAKSGTKLYRFYHQKTGRYVFTGKQDEIEKMKKNGWVYEGFAFYSGGNVPITRLYHPTTGQHFYTGNVHEVHAFVRKGWVNEGVGFFAESSVQKDIVEGLTYERVTSKGELRKKFFLVKNGVVLALYERDEYAFDKPLTRLELSDGGSSRFFKWFNEHDTIKSMRTVNGVTMSADISTTKYYVDTFLDFRIISAKQALATNLDKFKIMEDYVIEDTFILPMSRAHIQLLELGYTLKK